MGDLDFMRRLAKELSLMFKESTCIVEWDERIKEFYDKAEKNLIHLDKLGAYSVVLFYIDHVENILHLISIEPDGTIFQGTQKLNWSKK